MPSNLIESLKLTAEDIEAYTKRLQDNPFRPYLIPGKGKPMSAPDLVKIGELVRVEVVRDGLEVQIKIDPGFKLDDIAQGLNGSEVSFEVSNGYLSIIRKYK